mmetsp:Transcript_35747/g.89807  ORF Transcript_35747/g.89807 Transcript_35747/m.89807 type:complete len:291 (+) Transcript_35747:413-1285(+)
MSVNNLAKSVVGLPSPGSLLARSMLRLRASGIVRLRTHSSATSARGTRRLVLSRPISASSTSSSSSRWPPSSSVRPPGCTMVYVRPEATRYCSALRFHSRMLPLPMVLRKLPGCVPPMEETKTKDDTPAASAASICALAPSQSTASGSCPSGYLNLGRTPSLPVTLAHRTGRMDQGMSCGTALVHSTTASHPSMAAFRPADSAVMSPSTSASRAMPVSFTTLPALLSERTSPRTLNSCGRSSSFFTTRLPVRPPAPVTSTCWMPPAEMRTAMRRDCRRDAPGHEGHCHTS